MNSVAEQLALIRRGAAQVEKEDELVEKLQAGRPLRVKYGIDPTGVDVHLGHTVPLRKLRLFQELGHQAVLIIGNYTALVGDPSGRDQTRARLTPEQVEANARDYLTQVGKVIDLDRTEVHYNGDWFGKMTFLDVMALTGKITVQRMLERDDFTERIQSGKPISLHECLYPLMQGQDSVEVRADVELGGSEQLFNLMVGRRLQEMAGQEPQVCLTLPILRGLDGERRMGKSLGNYVGVGEPAFEQFAKTMRIPDTLLREWFLLLTDRPTEEVDRLVDPAQTHPMEAKKALAGDVVCFYHGEQAARDARSEWEKRVSGGEDPTDIPEVTVPRGELANGAVTAVKLLRLLELAPTNNEARRLIQGKAVNVGPERTVLTDPNAPVAVTDGLVVRAGKQRIRRVRLG